MTVFLVPVLAIDSELIPQKNATPILSSTANAAGLKEQMVEKVTAAAQVPVPVQVPAQVPVIPAMTAAKAKATVVKAKAKVAPNKPHGLGRFRAPFFV
jgi:hypothetical protein